MYQVAKKLPEQEKFGLANQIRRAAVSVTLQSRGSLEELLDDLNVCIDERYLPPEEIELLKQQGWRVRRLIDGYVRYLRRQKGSAAGLGSVKEDSPEYDEDVDSRFSI